MLHVVSKREYWAALEDPAVAESLSDTHGQIVTLKHLQDAWILSKCIGLSDRRILEVGGGFGRVLRTLHGNERWNLDKAGGPGRTVIETKRRMPPEFYVVDALMGEFSPEVPSDYFDVVFSISVIEHVPISAVKPFWQDHARVMKPGGVAYHAIDFYVGDKPYDNVEARLDAYSAGIRENGLDYLEEPTLERPLVFRSSFASNPDLAMHYWNELVPDLREAREERQCVCLVVGVRKPPW